MTTLAVIVPCRHEAAVIGRKLRNLALCEWPASSRPHRVVVVDDCSTDATHALATAELARFDASRVRAEAVSNEVRRGKTGAIEQGLATIGAEVDVIVVTDADVVLGRDALVELARAFDREPALGLACGAQAFVESLSDSGELRAQGGGPLRDANTFYDRFSALVRALESLRGLVFSVHGQLMAWRRELELHPTPEIAADDLDLMLQVRVAGRRVGRVRAARFYETRPASDEERDQQSIRRARAYVQFLRHPRLSELTQSGSALARMHARAYLELHGSFWLVALYLTCSSVFVFTGWLRWGWIATGAFMAAVVLLGLPFALVMRDVRRRMGFASSIERAAPMGDRWETARR